MKLNEIADRLDCRLRGRRRHRDPARRRHRAGGAGRPHLHRAREVPVEARERRAPRRSSSPIRSPAGSSPTAATGAAADGAALSGVRAGGGLLTDAPAPPNGIDPRELDRARRHARCRTWRSGRSCRSAPARRSARGRSSIPTWSIGPGARDRRRLHHPLAGLHPRPRRDRQPRHRAGRRRLGSEGFGFARQPDGTPLEDPAARRHRHRGRRRDRREHDDRSARRRRDPHRRRHEDRQPGADRPRRHGRPARAVRGAGRHRRQLRDRRRRGAGRAGRAWRTTCGSARASSRRRRPGFPTRSTPASTSPVIRPSRTASGSSRRPSTVSCRRCRKRVADLEQRIAELEEKLAECLRRRRSASRRAALLARPVAAPAPRPAAAAPIRPPTPQFLSRFDFRMSAAALGYRRRALLVGHALGRRLRFRRLRPRPADVSRRLSGAARQRSSGRSTQPEQLLPRRVGLGAPRRDRSRVRASPRVAPSGRSPEARLGRHERRARTRTCGGSIWRRDARRAGRLRSGDRSGRTSTTPGWATANWFYGGRCRHGSASTAARFGETTASTRRLPAADSRADPAGSGVRSRAAGALELFGGYERVVDADPLDRQTRQWAFVGFRLTGR